MIQKTTPSRPTPLHPAPTPSSRIKVPDRDLYGSSLPARRKSYKSPAPGEPITKEPRLPAAVEKKFRTLAFDMMYTAPLADPREIRWRHQHWETKRQQVLAALRSTGESAAKIHNFRNCGSAARSEWSAELQRRRLSAYYCKCRHCEPCARSKANKIAANLKAKLKLASMHEYRLITLTLKHSNRPLKEQLDRLYKSFRKLRSSELWKKSQRGGAAMLEVKWTGSEWHPHLHLVTQGNFISKEALSKAWHAITGDSFIVDIRSISRHEDAAHYVTKYITKSTSDSVWTSPDVAQEFLLATKGLRACNTFGSWRKYPLLKVSNPTRDWVSEGALIAIMERALDGERAAMGILNNLRPPGKENELDLSTAPRQASDDEPPI